MTTVGVWMWAPPPPFLPLLSSILLVSWAPPAGFPALPYFDLMATHDEAVRFDGFENLLKKGRLLNIGLTQKLYKSLAGDRE